MAIDKIRFGHQYEWKLKLYEKAIRTIRELATEGEVAYHPHHFHSDILGEIEELESALNENG
jgi:hypothetical protein